MPDNRGRTAQIEELIREAIRANALETHTMLPASIVSYDRPSQTATVSPEITRTFVDDAGTDILVEIPDLEDVPVIFPSSGGYTLGFPVQAGDKVMLQFAERDIQAWRDQGSDIPPGEDRTHSYSDAVAILGLRPRTDPHSQMPDDALVIREDGGAGYLQLSAAELELYHSGALRLTSDGASGIVVDATGGPIELTAAGAFTVNAVGAVTLTRGASELLDLLSQTLGVIAALTVTPITLGVAAPANNAAAATALQVLVDAMRT